MMSPDRTVTIGGKTFTLDGSFRTLKAIQTATGKDIQTVLAEAIYGRLRFDEYAALIRLGIEGGGAAAPEIEAIEHEAVDEIGIRQTGELVAEWLMAATSPKREREGNVNGLLAAIAAEKAARLKAARELSASRGKSTAKSRSAGSDGRRQSSGARPSAT